MPYIYTQIISLSMAQESGALAMVRRMMEYALDKHIRDTSGNPEHVEYRPFMSAVCFTPPFDDPRCLHAHVRLTLETV